MRVELSVVQGRGTPRSIHVEAPNVNEARRQAMASGLLVLEARPIGVGSGAALSWRGSKARFDVPVFVEQLRDLLAAGLSAIEALPALRRGARGDAVETIQRLERQLGDGKPLSDALASDSAFPPLLVALTRASELTSDLQSTLSRFLEHQQRVSELRHRLMATSIYPLLLIGVGGLVLLFLLFYVMPKFARVFEGMTGTLPWSARAMVAWSGVVQAHSTLWLLGLCAMAALVVAFIASPGLRASALTRVLAWPSLHDRLRVYFLASWYRATGLLLQGGIPLPQALQLTLELLPSGLRRQGQAVTQSINDGLSPSAAYVTAGMATPVAEQLMLAGERTGDLGAVLTRIAQFHELEVSRALERSMRALEPIVMVLIGLGVGVVVVLMYLPIFELAAAIQ